MRTIIDSGCAVVNESDLLGPIPRLLRPVGVRLVPGVAGKSGAETEEEAIGDTYTGQYPNYNPDTWQNSLFL